MVGSSPWICSARTWRARCLYGADLTEADLTRACLRGADLRGAYLTGAQLVDADLREADLAGAYLIATNLRRAVLTGAHLGGAIWDQATTWPDGSHSARPPAGTVHERAPKDP